MEALHEEMPFDLDFHPSSPLVVTSLITGDLCLYALPTARTLNPIPPPKFPVPVCLFLLPPQTNRFQSRWFHRFRYGPESPPERYSRKLCCCSCLLC
jgi:hypothetical protein